MLHHSAVRLLLLLIFIHQKFDSVLAETNLLYKFFGSYTEHKLIRDFSHFGFRNSSVDLPNACYNYCKNEKFIYFGLQDGSECWCGMSFGKYGLDRRSWFTCSSSKNGNMQCGGKLINSVYQIKSEIFHFINTAWQSEAMGDCVTSDSLSHVKYEMDLHFTSTHTTVDGYHWMAMQLKSPINLKAIAFSVIQSYYFDFAWLKLYGLEVWASSGVIDFGKDHCYNTEFHKHFNKSIFSFCGTIQSDFGFSHMWHIVDCNMIARTILIREKTPGENNLLLPAAIVIRNINFALSTELIADKFIKNQTQFTKHLINNSCFSVTAKSPISNITNIQLQCDQFQFNSKLLTINNSLHAVCCDDDYKVTEAFGIEGKVTHDINGKKVIFRFGVAVRPADFTTSSTTTTTTTILPTSTTQITTITTTTPTAKTSQPSQSSNNSSSYHLDHWTSYYVCEILNIDSGFLNDETVFYCQCVIFGIAFIIIVAYICYECHKFPKKLIEESRELDRQHKLLDQIDERWMERKRQRILEIREKEKQEREEMIKREREIEKEKQERKEMIKREREMEKEKERKRKQKERDEIKNKANIEKMRIRSSSRVGDLKYRWQTLNGSSRKNQMNFINPLELCKPINESDDNNDEDDAAVNFMEASKTKYEDDVNEEIDNDDDAIENLMEASEESDDDDNNDNPDENYF